MKVSDMMTSELNEYTTHNVENMTITELKAKVAAFETLYGKCEVYVKGEWYYPNGQSDYSLMYTHNWKAIESIGNKYITIAGYDKVELHDKYGDAGITGLRIVQV